MELPAPANGYSNAPNIKNLDLSKKATVLLQICNYYSLSVDWQKDDKSVGS
jgi:hypothetical protein